MPNPEDLISSGPVTQQQAETAHAATVTPVETVSTTVVTPDDSEAEVSQTTEEVKPSVIADTDDTPVDLSIFEKLKDGDDFSDLKKKKEEVKPEVKPVEELKPKEETKQELVIEKILEGDKLTTEEQKLFKQMSPHAREYIKAEIRRRNEKIESLQKEAEELKKKSSNTIPDSYLEHPDAYTLDPNYKQISANAQVLQGLSDYFKQQLTKIKDGEEWEDLVQSADGKIIQVKKPASAEAEVSVLSRLQETSADLNNLRSAADQFIGQYQSRVKTVKDGMKQLEDYYFPDYKAPDFLDKNEEAKLVVKKLNERGFGNNLLAPLVAKMYVANLANLRKIEELEKTNGKAAKIAEQQKLAGPTSTNIHRTAAAPSDPDDVPFDMNKFRELVNS